jgi:hypothetical protein
MKQLRGISNGVDGNNKFTPEKTRVPQRPLASSILSEARRSNAPDGVRFFFVWLELIGILHGPQADVQVLRRARRGGPLAI